MVRPGDRRARARSGHHRADRAEPAQRHARPPEEGAAGRGGERLALEPVPAGGVQERHRDVRAGRQAAAAHGHAGAVDVADPEVHLLRGGRRGDRGEQAERSRHQQVAPEPAHDALPGSRSIRCVCGRNISSLPGCALVTIGKPHPASYQHYCVALSPSVHLSPKRRAPILRLGAQAAAMLTWSTRKASPGRRFPAIASTVSRPPAWTSWTTATSCQPASTRVTPITSALSPSPPGVVACVAGPPARIRTDHAPEWPTATRST